MGTDRSVLVLDGDIAVVAALERATWLGRERLDEVHVRLPGIGPQQALESARRIRRATNDCGCRWGELSLVLAVATLWAGPAVVGAAGPGPAVSVPLALAAAVVGKLAGLAASRARLRIELRRVLAARTDRGESHGGDLP
ncbi:hypothetical protein GCM10023216_20760 [Isoptericola chiayiensis]|uniref:Uncharacterized protein n=1 Tax=Isoptericola chiayiensis TaxID=579446 RepID=A0ABP8YHJ6_9MICO|nr:hypothetical protein [Isoptericola chiayiensis]NOW00304.1 hypothetical protein [Isoptericola chiayiensis]